MKKSIVFILFTSLLISLTATPKSYAQKFYILDTSVNITEEYLPNGDILVITINPSIMTQNGIFRAANQIIGSKTSTYLNSNRETLWSFTVIGTFSINGSSVTCTEASHSVTIDDSRWSVSSQSSNASGNKANGTVKMNLYSLGILIETVTRSLTLTCDSNGNLS